MSKPKWRQFEELVARIQSELAPDASVVHDDTIVGRKSGVPRQLDVTIRQRTGQFDLLVVIECKNHRRPADVKDIEEFVGVVDDVGAHKAALVSAKGFTGAAKARAASAGIELYQVADSGPHDWGPKHVAVPVVYDDRSLRSVRLVISSAADIGVYDLQSTVLYDKDMVGMGTAVDLLMDAWNHGRITVEPGVHEDVAFVTEQANVIAGGKPVVVQLRAHITVDQRLYLGEVELKRFSGFINDQTAENSPFSSGGNIGQFVTNGFETKMIDIQEIDDRWIPISSLEQLAVQPYFTFVIVRTVIELKFD